MLSLLVDTLPHEFENQPSELLETRPLSSWAVRCFDSPGGTHAGLVSLVRLVRIEDGADWQS